MSLPRDTVGRTVTDPSATLDLALRRTPKRSAS
jgi:hypothetical protein